LIHLDLHHISLTENIQVEVAVTLVGSAAGVRNKGGIVQQPLHKIEVECLPTEIPEHIELNIEELDVGDSLHVSDITLETGRIVTDEQRTVVSIVPPTVIKEPEPAEVEEGEEPTEPELIGEAKEEEKEEEGEKEKKKEE
jgi:large subunit ribosomal protein L25